MNVQPIDPRKTLRMGTSIAHDGAIASDTEPDDAWTRPTEPVDLADLSKRAAALPARNNEAANDQVAPVGTVPAELERVLNWIVLGPYAKGGFSLLYEVTHATTRQRALLKLLKPHLREPINVERLLAEGRLGKSCSGNPYLAEFYDIGMHQRFGPFCIMELLHGGTLTDLIAKENAKGRAIDLTIAVNLTIAMAVGLQTMHDQGVIHRDFKPDNAFIVEHTNGERSVKIIDFGAAKSGMSPRSSHVPPVVTAMYMSPEQARGERNVTVAADIYALGLVLLEMIWEYPFATRIAGRRCELMDLIVLHAHAPMPLPPLHLVPAELTKIAMRACAKDPSDRYSSMTDFADALRTFLKSSWKLEDIPPEQKLPFRATVLNARAREAGKTQPDNAMPREMPKVPPAQVRTVPLEEVCPVATLLVLEPATLRGQRFELGQSGTIGRHPAVAGLILRHETVSNAHVEYFVVQPDGARPIYSIENRTEVNPAYMNERPLIAGAWGPNQILELGDVKMILLPAGKVAVRQGTFDFVPLSALAAAQRPVAPPPAPIVLPPDPRVKPSEARKKLVDPPRPAKLVPVWASHDQPTLVILEPKHLCGKRFELGNATVGRSPEVASIVIDDASISNEHARLVVDRASGALNVRDCGSAHGTFVRVGRELEPVLPQRGRALKHLSVIRFGRVEAWYWRPGRFSRDMERWIDPGQDPERSERQGRNGAAVAQRTPVKSQPRTSERALARRSAAPTKREWITAVVLLALTLLVGVVVVFIIIEKQRGLP
ncbi:MAG: protein kinase [Polyangiaceae bacterium]|nr:protein kinase [Polyangiaceae bacterium]